LIYDFTTLRKISTVSQIQDLIARTFNAKPTRVIKGKMKPISTKNIVGEQPIKRVSLSNEDRVLALMENPHGRNYGSWQGT
jgi:hypothetical protein